jgi:hypothetical protein
LAGQRAVLDRTSGVKLRIGLVVDSLELAAWKWRMVQKIAGSVCTELVLVFRLLPADKASGRNRTHRSFLRRLLDRAYEYWEARYECEPDAFASKNVMPLLSAVPVVRLPTLNVEDATGLESYDIERIRSAGLDVLINVAPQRLGNTATSLAKYGLWTIEHGDETRGFGAPPGFWEVFFGDPVTVTTLYSSTVSDKIPLSRTYSATDLTSTRRNNNARYWKAASLISRKLEDVYARGQGALIVKADAAGGKSNGFPGPSYAREPTTLELARFLGHRFRHALLSRVRELTTLPQWILMYRFADGAGVDIAQFKKLVPPKDRFWADPHVLYRDGNYYIFVEELLFQTSKGHISVIVMNEKGDCEQSVKVLERDYHLSYPCVFEAAGEIYMIPESADNQTIELYRCVEFPHRWEFVRNLLDGFAAFDATIVHHDAKWWLFANATEDRGACSWDELFLFYSDSLHGQWRPHRLNPVVSDVRSARPAGAIFTHEHALYRPSQDCSVRYGYRVKLNRITKLSADEYEETCETTIDPAPREGILGVHTYARAGALTMLDGLRPRWRM